MSVYNIKRSFLTPYDPYWICRLLSLKAGTTTIVLFIWNGFFFSPQSPMMFFMVALFGAMATEMLPAYTTKSKLILVWIFSMLLAFSTIIFGLFSYFNWLQLIAVSTLTYLLFRFLATNAQNAALPANMVMLGMIGIEGGSTSLNAVANNLLFFIMFTVIVTFVVCCFPNLRPLTFKSAFIRLLEKDAAEIKSATFTNNHPQLLSHLYFIKTQLPYLDQSYTHFYNDIVSFQLLLAERKTSDTNLLNAASSVLSEMAINVAEGQAFDTQSQSLMIIRSNDPDFYIALFGLVASWNILCNKA